MRSCRRAPRASRTSGRWIGASSSTSISSPPRARSSLARARERAPLSSLPGTASRARAEVARAKTLGRTQPAGPGQGRAHPDRHGGVGDHDLHELVRRVRGHAATGGHLQLGDQGFGCEVESIGGLVDGGLPHLGQPGQDGQEASQPVGGVRGHLSDAGPGGIRAGFAPARPPGCAPATVAWRRSTTAARTASGPDHFGVVQQVEDPEDQCTRHRSPTAAPRRLRRRPDRQPHSGPSSATTRPASAPSTRIVHLDLLTVAELPRVEGESPIHVEVVRDPGRAPGTRARASPRSGRRGRCGPPAGRGRNRPGTSGPCGSGDRPRRPAAAGPGTRTLPPHPGGWPRTGPGGPAGHRRRGGPPTGPGRPAGGDSPPAPNLSSACWPIGSPR